MKKTEGWLVNRWLMSEERSTPRTDTRADPLQQTAIASIRAPLLVIDAPLLGR